ncbi:MAG TPA: Hdr-like menaquinol oxidoreductase cytochrome c subunit [Gammaproteobacteria bacterium]
MRSVVLLLLLLLGSTGAGAAGRTPLPAYESGVGERCVADTDYMRRNHMELIRHQRDETVHRGIRTPRHSLRVCLGCHAVTADGKPVRLDDPQHFCQSCHRYAAVEPDCFQCHAGSPGPEDVARAAALAGELK